MCVVIRVDNDAIAFYPGHKQDFIAREDLMKKGPKTALTTDGVPNKANENGTKSSEWLPK